MKYLPEKLNSWSSIAVVLAGIGLMIVLEILEEPGLTLGEILVEMIQPALVVIVAVGLVRVTDQVRRQGAEHRLLVREMESARAEGLQWRNDMSELIKGLSHGIAKQFARWSLTAAEREVGMLILKGLSYKEIALLRDVSERTVRQQAHTIYRKAKLSGRAALSAFFLEDLLLPVDQNGRQFAAEDKGEPAD